MSQALRLPFDQYQRYRLVTDILDRVRTKGRSLRVLDVGGRTGLLRQFLKGDIVTLVDLEPSDITEGFVLGDGAALPFRDNAFDVVCAFDTLEHVPKAKRTEFVTECSRVAGSYTILAGPYDSPEVRHAEVLLRRFLKEKLGIQHRYLEEHRQNGLPKRNVVEGQLGSAGAEVVAVGHANLERWFGLMCLEFYLDDDPSLRKMAESIYEFYNRGLYASDHRAPVYRHAIVAAQGKAKLPDLSILFPEAAAPAGALAGFNEMLKSLIAFDLERGHWREERSAFERVIADLRSDLEGHRGTLQVSKADIDGNRKTVEVLRQDLEEHKRTIAALRERESELENERARVDGHRESAERRAAEFQAQSVYHSERFQEEHLHRQALEEDMRQHLLVLRELRESHSQAQASLKDISQDLTEHRAVLAEAKQRLAEYESTTAELSTRRDEALAHGATLEKELKEYKKVAAAHASEQKRLGDDRDRLAIQLGEVREELDRLQSLLVDERQQSSDLVSKLRGELAGHMQHAASLQNELNQVRGAHGEAVGELTKFREGTQSYQNELERVQAQARDLEARRHEAATQRDQLRSRIAELEEQVLTQGARYQSVESQLSVVAQMEREWDQERAAFNDTMADVLRELEEHRIVLIEAKKQRDEAFESMAIMEKDLDGHRRVLERTMVERDALTRTRDELLEERRKLQARVSEIERQVSG